MKNSGIMQTPFAASHPAIAEWIETKMDSFDFAASMANAVGRWGGLTAGQLAACERMAARDVARAADAIRNASAPAVVTDKLMAAFESAKASGLKRPKMRFEGFEASLAGEHSVNAGAVYLKSGETYLGKIAGGVFLATRELDDAKRSAIVATMADPLTAAVAFGKRTGNCSCCGRGLTDPVSVERGIGPICAEKFGI